MMRPHRPLTQAPNFSFAMLTLIASLILQILSTPAVAAEQGTGKRIKKFFGGKPRNIPDVKIATAKPTVEAIPQEKTAMRSALLVSIPRDGAAIPQGSTIAFIKLDHIEEKIQTPEPFATIIHETIETREISPSRTDTFSDIKRESYNFKICAAQVESALAQHLSDLKRYRIVTRNNIATVLEEQNFSNSGNVNSTTAARLGQLLGADILVYGTVQLCVSTRKDFQNLANLAHAAASEATGNKQGWFSKLLDTARDMGPEKLRAFVIAQIQLIESNTGKQLFTTSITGEFEESHSSFAFDIGHRELIFHAADNLANKFIDQLLARKEPLFIDFYNHPDWGTDTAIDYIQLGDCPSAEAYFRGIYDLHGTSMTHQELAQWMYNHSMALLCSNRPEEALDRLWASLRLSNDSAALAAIDLTNDLIDRGRRILTEVDPYVKGVRHQIHPPFSLEPQSAIESPPNTAEPTPQGR